MGALDTTPPSPHPKMQNIISPPNLRGLGLALDIVKLFSSPVHPSIRPSVKKMKKKMWSQLRLLWHDDEAIIENQRRRVAGGEEETI